MPNVGLAIPAYASDAQSSLAVEYGVRAEKAGVHSVWLGGDRPVSQWYDPLLTLATVATGTKRIRLSTLVLVPAYRHPAMLAKTLATLDQMSGGRLIVSIGAGRWAEDFQAAGVPFEQRGKRVEEIVDVLRMAWSGEPVRYQGRFYQLDVGPIGPRPIQQPCPPIWIAGIAEAVLRRAARTAEGYIFPSYGGGGLDGFRTAWGKIQRHASESGRDPSAITTAMGSFIQVENSYETAKAKMAEHLARTFGPGTAVPEWYMVGKPDDCVAVAQSLLDAGIKLPIVSPITNDLEQLDRVCTEVIPRIAALTARN